MNSINLKRVSLNEIDQLQKIGKQTFFETFASANTKEDMDAYLDEAFSIEKLTSELNNKNTEFYFAIWENKQIGYLKINIGQSQTALQDDKAIEIERIYVLKDFHGKEVGQALFEKALQISIIRNAEYIWLGVWEENPRAIKFYKKNGFVEFDKHVFKLGNDDQTDIMMKRMLEY